MTANAAERALLDAVEMLRSLPRAPGSKREAREAFERFRAAHASADPFLVIDHPPAAREVDFDVLLKDPAGGAIAVALRREGDPWAAHYADQWDAPWVVSAGDTFISVQWAVTSFSWAARSDPGLKARLEEDAIVCHRLEARTYQVSDEALQDAVDDFRRVHGLELEDLNVLSPGGPERVLQLHGWNLRDLGGAQ